MWSIYTSAEYSTYVRNIPLMYLSASSTCRGLRLSASGTTWPWWWGVSSWLDATSLPRVKYSLVIWKTRWRRSWRRTVQDNRGLPEPRIRDRRRTARSIGDGQPSLQLCHPMWLDDGGLGDGMSKTTGLDEDTLRPGSGTIECRRSWQRTTRSIDTRSTKRAKKSCMHTTSSVFPSLS